MNKKKIITVVGLGYVGTSMAALLAQKNQITAFDIDKKRVQKLNSLMSPIEDKDISRFLQDNKIKIEATSEIKSAYLNAEIVIICTPTNFNDETMLFDTSSIESIIEDILEINKEALIVIKSTIPIGYTKYLQEKYKTKDIIFSPEFLREGSALKDNLYPSRIVIGGKNKKCKMFAKLLIDAANTENEIKTFFVSSSEAEAIKLFSNTYLANRVAFFNEIDTFARAKGLNSKDIIKGVSADIRIGDFYNNPSFGYGGYCLPKDTKQLLSNFSDIPQSLVKATIDSNIKRKEFIASQIEMFKPKVIGVYKLSMKKGSDNFRSSAIFDVIKLLNKKGVEIRIYEPLIKEKHYNSYAIEKDLDEFKNVSDIIIANRLDEDLEDVNNKVFTSDIFGNN